jgi:hypothetical protein
MYRLIPCLNSGLEYLLFAWNGVTVNGLIEVASVFFFRASRVGLKKYL